MSARPIDLALPASVIEAVAERAAELLAAKIAAQTEQAR